MKNGLYANINAKQARIKAGSGEKMRKVGSKGAPTKADFVQSAKTAKKPKEEFSGFNKPKKTPSHPTKSHAVLAKSGDEVKLIRFGQQGATGSPDGTKRNEAFKARHAKNIAKGKMSAAFWSDRVKW